MRKPRRPLAALLLAAAVLTGLSACGGSGDSPPVARVGSVAITKATLEHWIPIEAVVSYKLFPKKPTPKGLIPIPPNYTACIAYLATTPELIRERGLKVSKAQLKSQCKARYETLKQVMMTFLITGWWEIGEGKEWGVKVSEEEVKQRLEGLKKHFLPTEADYQRYLALTGQTLSDEYFRERIQLFEVKLEQYLEAKRKRLGSKMDAFISEANKRWVSRTSCEPGYVVTQCRLSGGGAGGA
jgi:hypothetical protein